MENPFNLDYYTYTCICNMINLERVGVVLDELTHGDLLSAGFEEAEQRIKNSIQQYSHKKFGKSSPEVDIYVLMA